MILILRGLSHFNHISPTELSTFGIFHVKKKTEDMYFNIFLMTDFKLFLSMMEELFKCKN